MQADPSLHLNLQMSTAPYLDCNLKGPRARTSQLKPPQLPMVLADSIADSGEVWVTSLCSSRELIQPVIWVFQKSSTMKKNKREGLIFS
jgi:hypothetical protein